MPDTECERIALGPGGFILPNDERNKELLNQLRETPPLSPEALLKLTVFYKAFPTSVSLGNHLGLLALAGERVPQPTLFAEYSDWWDGFEDGLDHGKDEGRNDLLSFRTRKVIEQASVSQLSDLGDIIEDSLDGGLDEVSEQKAEGPTGAPQTFMLSVRWLPVLGIGLLIETFDVQGDPDVSSVSFVIGVSPDPAGLAL